MKGRVFDDYTAGAVTALFSIALADVVVRAIGWEVDWRTALCAVGWYVAGRYVWLRHHDQRRPGSLGNRSDGGPT